MRTDLELETVAFKVQTSVHIWTLRQGTQQGRQDGVLGGIKATHGRLVSCKEPLFSLGEDQPL